jgi:hypothetical protein
MHHYVESNPPSFSNGDVVEMDETCMKWQDGDLKGTWIIGAVDRAWTKCWMRVLSERKVGEMDGLIRSVVRSDAVIMTDALAGYPGIFERIGCEHHVINKKEEGFSRISEEGLEINVNKCECLWSRLRHLMHQRQMFQAETRHHLIAEFQYNMMQKSWVDLLKN